MIITIPTAVGILIGSAVIGFLFTYMYSSGRDAARYKELRTHDSRLILTPEEKKSMQGLVLAAEPLRRALGTYDNPEDMLSYLQEVASERRNKRYQIPNTKTITPPPKNFLEGMGRSEYSLCSYDSTVHIERD